MECYCVCATVELVSSVFTKLSLLKPANPYDSKYKDGMSYPILPFESLCFPVFLFSFSVSTPPVFSTLFVSNSLYVPFLSILSFF
jgi:hypothetical protein